MSATRDFATTIHDVIDELATTIEDIHKSVADFPLEVLGGVTSLDDTLDDVRSAQARYIGAVYQLIRRVNGQARTLTS